MTYSPWADLAGRSEVLLFWEPLEGELGYTRGQAIVLDPRQGRRQARCSLAHELAHRDRGDLSVDVDATPDGDRLAARHERQADELAARRLITLARLTDALLWSLDEWDLADELRVDIDTVRVRLAMLTDREKDHIESRITAKEGAA